MGSGPAAPGGVGRDGAARPFSGSCQILRRGKTVPPRLFIFFLINFIWFALGTSGARQGENAPRQWFAWERLRRASPETELTPSPCARRGHGDVGHHLPPQPAGPVAKAARGSFPRHEAFRRSSPRHEAKRDEPGVPRAEGRAP